MSIERDRLAEGLLSFAQLAPTALSEQVLVEELMARVAPWGVTHVAAGVMSDANRSFKLGPRFGKLNVAWATTYLSEQLYRDDPVMAYSLTAEQAKYWDATYDAGRLTRGQKRVLGFAQDLGAADGFMAPVPLYNGDIVIVSYQGDRLERHPDVAAVLRALALYFGVEGQRLVTGRRTRSSQLSGLTTRQLQVLHLSATGLRNRDIALELDISEKAVEAHLSRARERLGAANTKEAVAIIHAAPEATAPI
jgi:DNA-binding CsgD family transcriptional regulator